MNGVDEKLLKRRSFALGLGTAVGALVVSKAQAGNVGPLMARNNLADLNDASQARSSLSVPSSNEMDVALGDRRFLAVRAVDVGSSDPSTDYVNNVTIDGVTLVTGNYVLRATPGGNASDGVYEIVSSGASNRIAYFDAYDDYPGGLFSVQEGATYADTFWQCVSNIGGEINTTALTFVINSVDTFGYNVSLYPGADLGAKLQAAHDALPATGGILNATMFGGAQAFGASGVTFTKPVKLYLGACTIDMGTNSFIIRDTCEIVGVGRQDENNSTTVFKYSGTSDCFIIQNGTAATPIFAVILRNFEIAAYGSAITAVGAYAVSNYGGRYCEYHNILIYNFQNAPAFYFSGNGAVNNGFGATNMMFNCGVSTCKYGVLADAVGGSQSTHGMIYGGFLFGTTNGVNTSCESWRVHDTDLSSVSLNGAADDTVLVAIRIEANNTVCVYIEDTCDRCGVIMPSFINCTGTYISATGSYTYVGPVY